MQIHAPSTSAAAVAQPVVLAKQTIDIEATALPTGGVVQQMTEREFRLAGATEGIATYASAADAIEAARALSAGSMPGLAVVTWRGGFRVHDVHTSSRRYTEVSTHAPTPPRTTLTHRSSVPFAAGNLRFGEAAGRFNPAVVGSAQLVAFVDGNRTLVPGADTHAGQRLLVER